MASVSSVFKAQKFQFKIKTNLSTEARIKLNFGKLHETTAKVTAKTISLQNLHISGHIEIINIKKAILPLVGVKSFQSLLSVWPSLVFNLN